MKGYYRDPQVEEGLRNIILQNRCGNRLTLLMHEGRTDVELVYKPSAFRRREFRARNYSNRDNFTALFNSVTLPDIGAGLVKTFDYDPFVTRVSTLSDALARNLITVVNIADENCFAIAARQPLLIAIRPHERFEVRDGLLTESFTDRGEQIVSLVAFRSFEQSRYRITDDGQHVIQLLDNDVMLIGGEENAYQVSRVLGKLRELSLDELIAQTEQAVAPVLSQGRAIVSDDEVQRVLDLNRRLVYSQFDEGGASFGALQRIYHLIWVRDGSMTASLYAAAGCPRLAQIWAPFVLRNPSVERRERDGRLVREYLQLVGTRWSKGEDDGLFYVLLSLYHHYQSTGDDTLLSAADLRPLFDAIDHAVTTRLDKQRGIFGSDTRGESTLKSSPYYGYDVVNGEMDRHRVGTTTSSGREIAHSYSLYHNVNMYNVLRMACILLPAASGEYGDTAARYAAVAAQLVQDIDQQFVKEDGTFRADLLIMDDGSERWVDFAEADYWEYAWATSLGPFFPNPAVALKSARMVVQKWPGIRSYGYCPWNTLSRTLKDHGMGTADFRAMHVDQISEALKVTKKYPMPGALTEYYKHEESWRGLPFSAATFNLAVVSLLLQPLPMGIAVRASTLTDRVDNFAWRTARLDVSTTGTGDAVRSVTVNGQPLLGTLQIPEHRLRTGRNSIVVERGEPTGGPRLWSSTAALLDARVTDAGVELLLSSPVESDLTFENHTAGKVSITIAGRAVEVPPRPLPDTRLTLLRVPAGELRVVIG